MMLPKSISKLATSSKITILKRIEEVVTIRVTSFDVDKRDKATKRLSKKKIDLTKLNLSNDKLFALLMQNKEFCRLVLEIVLNVKIVNVEFVNVQQVFLNTPGYKTIRLDAFAKDANGTIYNVEMQKVNTGNLPMRLRFYHGLMDTASLLEGRDYSELPKSYVIFITESDLFNQDHYCYTFRNTCDEVPELSLNDGCVKIFLNTKGNQKGEESTELLHFLQFVEDSTLAVDKEDTALLQLQSLYNTLVRSKRMQTEYQHNEQIKEEGREEGEQLLTTLISKLLECGRLNDVQKAAFSKEYR